ncbi:class I SAM-dependent methyltransferase [candidate division KSB1 bacterium]|nr:class I SAM-dependent methyltransferase [candidate division KSB1 bacterium]
MINRIKNAFENIAVWFLPSKYANLLLCRRRGRWSNYFISAESAMEEQWRTIIWPLIKDFSFDAVLELAPGAGRNTRKLCSVAKRVLAVDLNEYALRQCRRQLGDSVSGCRIEYHRNNGRDLRMIEAGAISAVYSWDSAVHFDKEVMEHYIAEFARVLRPGGKGFVHHANLGDQAHKNIKRNPHARSNMSKELFARYCRDNDLVVIDQIDMPWGEIVDCITLFAKHGKIDA